MTKTTFHVVLLGDSIFDNAAYVPEGPAVIDHLKRVLPIDWKATLVARDGNVVAHLAEQMEKVPPDATHLVVSVGGNDALQVLGILSSPAGTVNDALKQLAEIRTEFQNAYRVMLWQLLSLEHPLAVCTIYDAVPGLSAAEQTALCLFNDTIVREALAVNVPVIDLRHVCNEPADYSAQSPIEPSGQGGGKIANAITRWLFNFQAHFSEPQLGTRS